MSKYKVIAKAKDRWCPHVQVGDSVVIEGTMVNLQESKNVCAVALGAILYSLFMMGKADDPKDLGRDEVYTLQCPDPETRVMFEVSRIRGLSPAPSGSCRTSSASSSSRSYPLVAMLLVSYAVFKVNLEIDVWLLLFIVLDVFAFVGIGMILTRFVKEAQSAAGAANAIMFPMMFLSAAASHRDCA
jgi:uncharacterized repeat protein (TIGR04076 family)